MNTFVQRLALVVILQQLVGFAAAGEEKHKHPVLVLVHSPLVGPATWAQLRPELQKRGFDVRTPKLTTEPTSAGPYWPNHVSSIAKSVEDLGRDQEIILVAHSGAGVLLPAIREALPDGSVAGYVFVDALFPEDMKSRLDLFETPTAAAEFRASARNGLLPVWSEEDLRQEIPEKDVRERFVSELRPLPLAVYEEPISVFVDWPDAPCAYIQFTPIYGIHADRARRSGCLFRKIGGSHFQMLVSPAAVADAIAASVQEMQRKGIADLEAAEEKWDQAVRTGNASALEEVFADEFIDTTAKGQVLSKSEYVSGFRKDPPRVKSLQVEGRQVRLFGNVAVVTGKFRTVTIEKGKEVIEAGRFTDVWIRRKNRWQCVAAHSSTLNDHSRRVRPG